MHIEVDVRFGGMFGIKDEVIRLTHGAAMSLNLGAAVISYREHQFHWCLLDGPAVLSGRRPVIPGQTGQFAAPAHREFLPLADHGE